MGNRKPVTTAMSQDDGDATLLTFPRKSGRVMPLFARSRLGIETPGRNAGRVSSQRNKVHSVSTLRRVASELGVTEEAIWEAADGLDTEDGLIWVYDVGEEQTLAFTDDGIEELQSALKNYR